VHFIRHGEGFHNIGFDGNLDAHLTPTGWEQAHALNRHIRQLQPPLDIQVIVVSPLVRTLETATGAFGSGPSRTPNDMFMWQLPGQNQWSTEHGAVALPIGIPVISHEGCRERVSVSRCDARRSLTETKQQFPGVDFSRIQSEEDTMYPRFCQQNGRGFGGEPEDNVTKRGLAFLSWLMNRPESRIAVSHIVAGCFTLCQHSAIPLRLSSLHR